MRRFNYGEMYNFKIKHPLGPLNWIRNREILRFFNRIPKNKGIKILDLGCGKAYLDIELAKRKYNATGVDLSSEALFFAKNLAKKNHVANRTKFIQSDIKKLNLKDKYDVVICSEVIEHFKDDNSVVKIIYDSLKNGGYGIITVPYNPKLWNPLDEASGHYHRYSIRQISDLIKKNGLVIKRMRVYGFPLMRIFRFFYNMTLAKKKTSSNNECLIHSYGYTPKGGMLSLYNLLSPIIFRIFYFDDFFNFTRKGIDIIILVRKTG